MATGHDEAVPKDFHHPFTPYDIQVQFMTAVYDAIEDGCVGIFESPTGTGKSLSLLCGSLTWLREHKAKELEAELQEEEIDPDEPEWVRQFAMEDKKKKILQTRIEMENRLKAIRDKERREKEALSNNGPRKRQRIEIEREDRDKDEDQYLLEDYDSDSEGSGVKAGVAGRYQDLSSETIALMKKLGYDTSADVKQEDTEHPDELKIYYCSRTHSQLSQFISELRRIKLPSALPTTEVPTEEVKQLTLGSRKNLCINPGVKKLSSATAVNEKCLELQQSSSSGGRCKFLPTMEEKYKFNEFRDHALASVRDIEELGELGAKMQICPYYGARHALRPTELVALPYPLLLQKSAREALGISLKGHVVIIDEAHNLMDAVESMYSTKVSLAQLQRAKDLVVTYLGKFAKRLKGKNRVYIAQLLKVLNSLIGYVDASAGGRQAKVVAPNDILARNGADQINLLKLIRYLNESKLPRKVEGYAVMKAEEGQDDKSKAKTSRTEVPILNHLQTFLMALTNLMDEGKVFCGIIDEQTKAVGYSYMLLDPAFHFREIVEEAKSVILAGGTMSPMSDYITHLLPYLPTPRIRTLSCGHVIPKSNLLAWPLSKGPSGKDLEFTFQNRSDPALIEELGKTIINLCIVIPHGVVVFFPSYAYLDLVIAQFKKTTFGDKTLWDRLCQRKKVFLESAGSSSVDETLRSYGAAVDQGNGALLLSVVGGKMSEGINFNDNLGRGVLMVGLPFPNANSAEWKAKMAHIESVTLLGLKAKGETEGKAREAGRAAAREFYENACMRAVNQSIGRAIRHQNDYAVIILLDKRFQSERIKKKLPGWIGESLESGVDAKFGDLMTATTKFFRGKKAQ